MKIYVYLLILIVLNSCNLNVPGTLGGGKTYRYQCTKEKLNIYLDSIEKYESSLKIPEKWKKYDDWDSSGYGFLRGKIFYIKGNNNDCDEMYYVTVIPSIDKTNTNPGVAIRSVFRTKEYLLGWILFKDLDKSLKKEIEYKFYTRVLSRIPLDTISVPPLARAEISTTASASFQTRTHYQK